MRLRSKKWVLLTLNYIKRVNSVDDLTNDMINFVEYSFNDDIFYMRLSGANKTFFVVVYY